MATFFTGDTHFGHGGAKALYRRPFASVAAMDDAMETRWNAVVSAVDEVWHLGDFAIGHAGPAALLERLHGRKHLVIGNNDTERTSGLPGWASTCHYAEIAEGQHHLVLCHYAFRSWRNMGKGWINLHGHSHGRLKPMPRQFDVGVDVWDFQPVTLATMLARRPRPGSAVNPPPG
jgi:calcineurin-like phosphoesterase family protein